MGYFVDRRANPFPNLSGMPTTILTADTHTIDVEGFWITNMTDNEIRFILKKERTGDTTDTFIYETAKSVQAREGKYFRFPIRLEFSNTSGNEFVDSLVCYSKGYTQIFNIEVNYVIYKELPMS